MEVFTKFSVDWKNTSNDASNPFENLRLSTSDDNQCNEDSMLNDDQANEKNDDENKQETQLNRQMNGKLTKKDRQSKYPLLPPCRICGDRSSGFHYGATTCEACKGFFRRTLYRKKEFTCFKGTYDCDVMAPKKAPCPGCRYKKCMEAGMSKNGVKRGRYSLTRKTFNIMEVKGLQSTDLSPAPSKLAPNGPITPQVPSPSSPPLPTSFDTSVQPSTSMEALPLTDLPRNIKTDVTKVIALEEFHKRQPFIKNLCQAYNKCCRYPEDILNNLQQIQEDYVNVKHEHCEFFGPWDLVDQNTFLEFYKSTGIDVDYRIAYFKDRFASIEQSICSLVDFAKSIPGFQSISLADQITLVKSVQFHWWFLCSFDGFSTETMIYTASSGDCVFKHEMQRFTGEEYAEMVFSMGELFSSLELDETEMALVIALCVFSSDFAIRDLHNFAAIDALHQEMGEALYFYTKSCKDSGRFGHIISALTALRSAEKVHIEGRNRAWKIFEETQFAIDVPYLMMELWSGMIPAFDPEKIMEAISGQGQTLHQLLKKVNPETE